MADTTTYMRIGSCRDGRAYFETRFADGTCPNVYHLDWLELADLELAGSFLPFVGVEPCEVTADEASWQYARNVLLQRSLQAAGVELVIERVYECMAAGLLIASQAILAIRAAKC